MVDNVLSELIMINNGQRLFAMLNIDAISCPRKKGSGLSNERLVYECDFSTTNHTNNLALSTTENN